MKFNYVQEMFKKKFQKIKANMKKTGLNGYLYDFSVDYDAITVDDILDIHKYLIKRQCKIKFRFI